MKRDFIPLLLSVLVTLAAVLTFASGDAGAVTVKGKVANGTTGETNIDIDVTIVNPFGGMRAERKVRAIGGEFSVENLDDSVSVYIVRIDYKGVQYDYPVRLTGADPVETTAYIYEQTTSWKGVSVAVPRFTVTRHGDHLELERVYEITNNTVPLSTIAGDDGDFKITLPEELVSFNGLYVSALGIPIQREPIKTDTPGIYRVDYPIRPGVTRVGVSYTVPYNDGHFVLSEKILYDVDGFTILSDDPEITITSETNELIAVEDPDVAVAYVVEGLKRNDELHLHFAGGGGGGVAETPRAAIQIVPNATESISFTVMAILLISLLAFAGMALKETKEPSGQKKQLEQHESVLLARLAKLDDLYETQAVPAAAYYAKRSELKGQLASLMYRLGRGGEGGGKGKAGARVGRHNKKGSYSQ